MTDRIRDSLLAVVAREEPGAEAAAADHVVHRGGRLACDAYGAARVGGHVFLIVVRDDEAIDRCRDTAQPD